MAKYLTSGSILMLALASPTVAAPSPTFEKPRLVLQITVDQLRGDLPTRYFDRLGKGGLRYLLEKGIHYNNAHHAHANTETIVGHVTLATGAHPAAILTTTFSDELASLTAGKARIFGVSVKDRGAVSMAGDTGKAFWFSKSTNQFASGSAAPADL